MIKIYISGNRADVTEREPLTSGTVGKVLNFAFTEDWRPLIKYAVFEASGRCIALTNIGDSCIIPHEVLAKHGGALRVGVYGRTADGSAATPTVYAQLGIIQRGEDPNADPSTKPTLPVWAQIQAQIGDMAALETEAKDSLVAAINEAAKSGGDAAADPTLGLTGATVGQIAKIAAVDASGVPTAWSPVDMPSGGGGSAETFELIKYIKTTEAVNEIRINEDDIGEPFELEEAQIYTKLYLKDDAADPILIKLHSSINGSDTNYNWPFIARSPSLKSNTAAQYPAAYAGHFKPKDYTINNKKYWVADTWSAPAVSGRGAGDDGAAADQHAGRGRCDRAADGGVLPRLDGWHGIRSR